MSYTIVWFPFVKLGVSLLLLYWASRPLMSHWRRYIAENANGASGGRVMPPAKAFIRLAVVLAVIIISPLRLAPGEHAERTLRNFDTPIHKEIPKIEAKPRKLYEAPNHEAEIQTITNQDS